MRKDRGKLDDTLAAMFSNIQYRTDYLFYAHMIGQCKIIIDETVPSPAGVNFTFDHYNLYINPTMFDKYELITRLAILKHEMLHILFGHVQPKGKDIRILDEDNHLMKNIAYDCALNQHITKDHLPKITQEYLDEISDETMAKLITENKVPKIGEINAILPETWPFKDIPNVKTMESAEYYYEILKQDMEENPDKYQQEGEGMEGSGYGSMDDHDKWKESEGSDQLQADITKGMIDKASTETIKGKGNVPSECSEWLSIHSRNAEVNWKQVLRNIVGNKRVGKRSTIMKNDRRFPQRADLRGKTKDRMFNLLVIADVSGSMSDKAVLDTLAEVRHICDMTKTDVDLIQIDARAYLPEKLSKKTKLIKRKGYGGTNLHPALDMAREHKLDYQAVVVLTDGGLWDNDIEHFSQLGKKVIWLIEEHGSIMPEMNTGRMQAFQLRGE